jgi:hypothetical protein
MKYMVRGYYGSGGRKGGKNRPGERADDLAVEVACRNESVRDLEVKVLRERADIGRIVTWTEVEVR